MNSPTHSLLALALLSKEGHKKRNWAIFIGSVIPDIAIYIWAPYQKFVNGVSGEEMWGKLYFEPPMQNLIAYFNSVPIYAVLTAIGYAARVKLWGKIMMFLGLPPLSILPLIYPCIATMRISIFGPYLIGGFTRQFLITKRIFTAEQ